MRPSVPPMRWWRSCELEDAINSPEHDEGSIIKAGRYAALGFEFAGTVVAGVLLGYYIDTRLGTPPLFTLLLTMGGMGGALYRLLWSVKRFSSRSKNGD